MGCERQRPRDNKYISHNAPDHRTDQHKRSKTRYQHRGWGHFGVFLSYAVIISVLVLRADLYFESTPLFDRPEALVGFW